MDDDLIPDETHQYFIGQAIAGLCANPAVIGQSPIGGIGLHDASVNDLAILAHQIADTVIKLGEGK